MREAVPVAFLPRTSHQPAFVVMGPGSRPGRRVERAHPLHVVPAKAGTHAGKFMREVGPVAFLRRTSQQRAFVVMGPGTRPGRRIVYDALARTNPMDSTFKQPNHVIAEPTGRANARSDDRLREAIHSTASGKLDCFRCARAMTLRHNSRDLAECFFRELFNYLFPPSPNGGRRECRAPDAPRGSRVQAGSGRAHTSIQVTAPESPGIPHAMVLTATPCSPRCSGSLATVTPEKLASQELDTSVEVSGPHDFARPRQTPFVIGASASTASRPAAVTIATRPSFGTGRL